MAFIPILDALTPAINKVLSYIPDPQQRLEAQHQLISDIQVWDSQQTSINVEEAKNENIFVSGWRPFIGWVCGVAFAYKFIIQPLLIFIIVACQVKFDIDDLPEMDWTEMSTVLLGMMGLGGMRTFEKIKSR